jgi:outer membrane protein assembly factor BamB
VVAVDLTTRALLWGFQYPRAVDPSYQNRMFQIRFGGLPVNDASESDRWTDASVTIAEGRVLLTPLESSKIHCLNLLDGKLEWQEDRGNGLYVACIHDGKAIVVDNRDVRALKLADGKPAWKESAVSLPSGSMPSGRGFFDGERYYLPLTSAEVAAIDAVTGKIVGRSRSRGGAVPGNLICYQGAVISQGIDHLECFYQLEDLRHQVAATLKEHPDDPQAMARRGELLLDEGKLDEAIGDLRRSFELKADPRTRELLVDALLEGLRVDFPRWRRDAEQIERLAEPPAERARYQRLMAAGLQQAGESLAAFDAYARMVDLKNPASELERVEHALSVRRDRWICARLAGLWEKATPDDRETIRARLHSMLEEVKTDGGPDALRAFISYFGPFPEADEAREALAARLLGGESLLEAEQLLRRLAASGEPARARAATARLAQLLLKAGRHADAAIHCRILEDRWADVACLDGKSGRQLVEELAMAEPLRRQLAGPAVWPEGEVEQHAEASAAMPANRTSIDFRGPLGPYFEHMTLESDQQQGALLGRDSLGRETWRVALHERGGMNAMGFNPAINHVRVDGHYLLASLGSQVVAVDTLGAPAKGGPRILWRQELGDGSGLMRQATIRAVNMPWGMPRVQAIDMHGRPIGNTGPLGDDYVCFQRMRNLAVVHPLTGTNLWVRSDVPAGSEIFGDEALLFVVPPNAHEAIVYRTIDGEEMGRRPLPSFEQRIVALGRLVLAWTLGEAGGKAALKLVDPWEQKELWRREFDADARFSCLGEEAIGVLERSGKYVLIDLPSGRARLEAKVSSEPSLSEIYILRSPTRELLITNRPWQQNNLHVMPSQNPGFVINGMIHGFDRQTGEKVYSTRLEYQGLSASQPYDLPILTFAANVQPQRNASAPRGSVTCLDKRNGRVVYQENLNVPIGAVDIVSDVDKHEVTVRTMKSSKRLVFTDRPLPAAPANEKKDKPKATDSTSRRAGRAVLRGFRKWAGDVTDAPPIELPPGEAKAAAAK